MDSQKFDSLVKSLASSTSRRRALKGAAVLGAGSLLGVIGRQDAAAIRDAERGQCTGEGLEKCGRHCCSASSFCCGGECCGNNRRCVQGNCVR